MRWRRYFNTLFETSEAYLEMAFLKESDFQKTHRQAGPQPCRNKNMYLPSARCIHVQLAPSSR